MFSKVHQRIHDMGKKSRCEWLVCFEFSFVNPCLTKILARYERIFHSLTSGYQLNNRYQPLILTVIYFQLTGNAYQTAYKPLNYL